MLRACATPAIVQNGYTMTMTAIANNASRNRGTSRLPAGDEDGGADDAPAGLRPVEHRVMKCLLSGPISAAETNR